MTEAEITYKLNLLISAARLQGAMMADKSLDSMTRDELRDEVFRLRDELTYELARG